jgi:hypothetical protein
VRRGRAWPQNAFQPEHHGIDVEGRRLVREHSCAFFTHLVRVLMVRDLNSTKSASERYRNG